jgi:hypothetical protein
VNQFQSVRAWTAGFAAVDLPGAYSGTHRAPADARELGDSSKLMSGMRHQNFAHTLSFLAEQSLYQQVLGV